ncbi:CcdC family protein [Brevibacillus sp. B_LB10_24]|uniref:CcdC family protein n=1 Tax=Brevibacillus sp. B_LB10_24 TaxID=3380645 RepID=UPI0038BD631E
MDHLLSPAVIGLAVGLCMAMFVMFVRLRAAKKPVSMKKIIIPPIAMSTGFAMFFFPGTASPFPYDILAFFAGTLLSIPLILSSKFEVKGNEIYLKRSRAFIAILLCLVLIRSGIKLWIGDSISAMQSAGLFFILAFGMILTWRIAMLIKYRQLAKN